jgi:ABC-type Fe3+-hydroxamate transport system substrate-binding protein
MWASLKRSIENPKKIISLVPSQTELLYYLGLHTETVGITKFCVHPSDWFHNKKRIGGTKNPNLELIRELNPDLIIANKEENNKGDVELLANDFPVWVTDVKNINDTFGMIDDIGKLTQKTELSHILISKIQEKLKQRFNNTSSRKLKGVYLIWQNPYMTIGGDTYIHEMLNLAGIENVFEKEIRYPEISDLTEIMKNAELILLSSEPYPFSEKHINHLKMLFPDKKILLVDGEMFSWYGPRLLASIPYLNNINEQLNHIGL